MKQIEDQVALGVITPGYAADLLLREFSASFDDQQMWNVSMHIRSNSIFIINN